MTALATALVAPSTNIFCRAFSSGGAALVRRSVGGSSAARRTTPAAAATAASSSRLFSATADADAVVDTSTDADDSIAESSGEVDPNEAVTASLKSPFLQTMRDRGFLFQCTNLADLDDVLLANGGEESGALPVSAYLGFDATANSLHVGSLLQIMILRHFQKCGHRPIVLIGGGTSKVGDPTGKDESRLLLTDDVIKQNTDGISQVFQKFLTFADDGDSSDTSDAIMVNNDEWLSSLNYLEFLRDYGKHFTINRMLSFESVKQRLSRETPFSFLEFNYMILQAYDFLELSRRYNAKLQLGGSDQWGNMISGCELGRRVDSTQLYALTAPLITTSDGKKMGKTAGGAMWLNADRLSEYDYWQFWRNTDDGDVGRFLKLFTELDLEEIERMEGWTGADINKAKVVLADEATALLHGRECLDAVRETADSMFKKNQKGSGGDSTEGLNRVFVTSDEVGEGVKFIDLFVKLKLANSKKEARRLVQGGGAKLGDVKIEDENATLGADEFGEKGEVTLRAGKKRAGVVELKD